VQCSYYKGGEDWKVHDDGTCWNHNGSKDPIMWERCYFSGTYVGAHKCK
jgi:hypothetical protein